MSTTVPGPHPDMPFNPTFTVQSDASSPGEQVQHIRGGAQSSLLCGIYLLCQFTLKKKKKEKKKGGNSNSNMLFHPKLTVRSDTNSSGEQGQRVRGGAEGSLLCGVWVSSL